MIHFHGIRHHGPGSARSLVAALDAHKPDLILLELPVEAEPMLVYAGEEDMVPPVALLFHRVDQPNCASYYPFAEFSPEWQAIRWAMSRRVPVRCFDLPSAYMMALRDEPINIEACPVETTEESDVESELEEMPTRQDPFEWFARADGYSDGERWWNDRVEESRNGGDIFLAIEEAVGELRTSLNLPESRETLLREAWMRKCLRTAEKEGANTISVICGAWHVPALKLPIKASADNELLKNLPKHKIAATWIPWTDERLMLDCGYGAGIRSPGWYRHLWAHTDDPIPSWITKAARAFRKKGMDASSASVIEAVRLASSLAGLRGRPLPGLDETMEAMKSVMCQGDSQLLNLLRTELLIGSRLGTLPSGVPRLPLQVDIEACQRQLRLKPTASSTPIELDLRDDGGRARSIFLHRLLALAIPWGKKTRASGKGTFKETWTLEWKPELALAIIDAAAFGNTVESAAANRLSQALAADATIAEITRSLDLALLGTLPQAVDILLQRLETAAAGTHAIAELLEAMPPLAGIARYGDVRATDASAVLHLLTGLAARIHVGLLTAASNIDEAAADLLAKGVREYAAALAVLDIADLIREFHTVLETMAEREAVHPKLRGHAVRLLRDAAKLDDADAARHLGFALSSGMPALSAAAWLEGFLDGGGSLLVHDKGLLGIVDGWLSSLSSDSFQSILPLMRRTFGTFAAPERARIASSVSMGQQMQQVAFTTKNLNVQRALPAALAVAKLLGLPHSP